MDQPTDHDHLIARAIAAWYLAAPADPDRYPAPSASAVVEVDGLRYVVLRTAAETVLAVYRVVPANRTAPVRLRLMRRPPAAVAS